MLPQKNGFFSQRTIKNILKLIIWELFLSGNYFTMKKLKNIYKPLPLGFLFIFVPFLSLPCFRLSNYKTCLHPGRTCKTKITHVKIICLNEILLHIQSDHHKNDNSDEDFKFQGNPNVWYKCIND